ncbi:MAG: di-heme enzyme [Saprospiraceae bacterium]|nr:MAG: di-heme enzyme [Saprospiraceae bacterium]
MKKFVLLLLMGGIVFACTKDRLVDPLDIALDKALKRIAPTGTRDYFELPESEDLAAIPQDFVNNPLTPEKVALGKMLFFETGLARDSKYDSGKGTYSCSSCHVPSAGFMPGRKQGIADGGTGFGENGEFRSQSSNYAEDELDVQGARPLSMLNTAYVTNSTWSGKFGATHVNVGTEALWGTPEDELTEINHLGYQGLESQNIEGLSLHRMRIDEYVLDTLGYRPMFDEAFPDFPEEERYGVVTTSFALSAYIRNLLPTKAPFQQWVKGNYDAMTDIQKEGGLLFFGKAGCYRCHKGAALSSVEFHALGVGDLCDVDALNTGTTDIRNFGRGGFTGESEDLFKFKVPQLYNLKDSPFYFHGSSKNTLWGVVDYFNRAEPENPRVPVSQISPFFHPLNMSIVEIQQLVAFLGDGLRDPDLQRFAPEAVLSGNCFPNNDPESQQDLGCQ